jgi:hypothetical protein
MGHEHWKKDREGIRMVTHARARAGRRRRGSGLSLMVVLSVVVTGLIITLAWSAGLQAQVSANRIKADESFYAADAALQWAIYEMRQDPTWRPAANQTVAVNGWTCAISYTDVGSPTGVLGNPLQFTARASKNGVASSETVSATVAGVLKYAPQFYSGGDLTIAQSANINGDIETLGKLTINAPTGGAAVGKVKGNVKAKKNVTDNNPTKSPTYFASTPVGSDNTLAAPSQTIQQVHDNVLALGYVDVSTILDYTSYPGKIVLDFTKAGGKPVRVTGASSYSYGGAVGIKGSGTLVMEGSVTFGGGFPFNATTANMNLIIMGDATLNPGPLNITGSFYVKGNWVQNGAYNLKGTVMSEGTTQLLGTGTVDTATPPTFDPRYIPRITSYVGTLP